MSESDAVSREQWLIERRELLRAEKAFTRARDALSAKRREVPRVRIDKDYRFRGVDGEHTLEELFGAHGQLLLYHFMFCPGWEEGCPSCSFWGDNCYNYREGGAPIQELPGLSVFARDDSGAVFHT